MRCIFMLLLILINFNTSLFSVPFKEGFIEAEVAKGGFSLDNEYFYYHDYNSFNVMNIENPQNPVLVGTVFHPISTGDFDEGFSTFNIFENYLICHQYLIDDVGTGSQEYNVTSIFDISSPTRGQ